MQQVHINRLGVNSIEFEMDTVELPLSPGEERSFEIVIINYGAPTHVNLSPGDSLRDNITVLEDNPYVKHEEYIPVIARIPYEGRMYTKGQFYITVGYGSKRQAFNLNIGHPSPAEKGYAVEVDESLYKPAPSSGQSKPKAKKPSSPSRKKDSWSVQLPSVSADIMDSVLRVFSSNSGSIVKIVFVLLLLSALFIFVKSMDFSKFFGFYHSVFYSILITFFMVYLLVRLPNTK